MSFNDDIQTPKTTTVLFSKDARKLLFEGLETAALAVGCTLGPCGKTVLIQLNGEKPVVTKDGVTVCKSVKLADPVKRMGAELLREAATQTNDLAGDGTTTATVLTYAMVKEGLKLLSAGYSAEELCSGITYACNLVDQIVLKNAMPISTSEKLAQIGTISANGDVAIGEILAEAMKIVGYDGVITIEDAKGMSTSLDILEGMRFDRGYLSPYFVTNTDKMTVSYQDAFVLVTDKKLSSLRELIPVLEQVVQAQKPLLIIAEDVEGEALQGLVLNRVKTQLPVVAIKAPGYGPSKLAALQDICALTGSKLVSASTGVKLESAFSSLGKIKKVIVDAKTTTIVGTGATKGDVDTLVNDLRSQLDDVTLSQDEIQHLKLRIAKLASGVAVIKVGGATEIEMTERKYRIEDALNATRAAAEEGIVPGGGMALINAYNTVATSLPLPSTVKVGATIVLNACLAPLRKIVDNAGLSSDVVLETLSKTRNDQMLGFNAAKNRYENMIDAGIIDPVKVTRTALKHAASVAITFLTLDAVVYEEESK